MIFTVTAIAFLALGAFETWVYIDHRYEEDFYIMVISYALALYGTMIKILGG